MTNLKEFTNPTIDAINKHWEKRNEEGHRPHLGASLIGKECLRELWYVFRHCQQSTFPGRIQRLFERGQREEALFVEELRAIGVRITDLDSDGNQLRIGDIGNHFGGSLDGLIEGGLKESNKPHIAEFKTHNDKSFKLLVKDGVEKSKPQHYAQMQIYMHYMSVDRAFYEAVNKNDDSLYTERIKYCKKTALKLIEKAETVINAKFPPEKLTQNSTDWRCRFCDFKDICHGNKVAEVNCRTCVNSTPEMDGDGKWSCKHWGEMPKGFTGSDCDKHLFIPGVLPGLEVQESDGVTWVRYIDPSDGVEVINGVGGLTSKQMYEMENVT